MRVPGTWLLLLACALCMAAAGDNEDIAKVRTRKRQQAFTWQAWSKETFDRARTERKFILFHGAAEWCHWCHVMEETTYTDPAVGKAIAERFIAVRVDVDSRPDLAERYAAWGWPATVVLSADAEELGKYRGYIAADQMLSMLNAVTTAAERVETPMPADGAPAPVDALAWIAARTMRDMDGYYDAELGGWGKRQKLPLGANVEFELRRFAHGDTSALERATSSLKAQRAIMDGVWGGIYQYSTGGNWKSPHYEKLLTQQTSALEANARVYQVTQDAQRLEDATNLARYLRDFLTSPAGTFYVNQDADLGSHDRAGAFVEGKTYYALAGAKRRALGIPWVDTHVYARENGLAIAALCALHEASGDPEALDAARKAADAILRSHVLPNGTVIHSAERNDGPYFLADAAAFGRALVRLAQITGDPSYQDAALKVANTMLANFQEQGGALFEQSQDVAAAGVFSRREKPFVHNVVAARFLAGLHALTHSATWQQKARVILAAISTPRFLDDQGRLLGEFLLALDEADAIRWNP